MKTLIPTVCLLLANIVCAAQFVKSDQEAFSSLAHNQIEWTYSIGKNRNGKFKSFKEILLNQTEQAVSLPRGGRCPISNLPYDPPTDDPNSTITRNGDIGKAGANVVKAEGYLIATQPNTGLYLYYAGVQIDPLHELKDNPQFQVKLHVIDSTGTEQEILCASYTEKSASANPKWRKCDETISTEVPDGTNLKRKATNIDPLAPYFLDWQSLTYILPMNKVVRITIITSDCALSGHFSMSYISAEIKPIQIDVEGELLCYSSRGVKLTAPPGVKNLIWSHSGDTTRSIVVYEPGVYELAYSDPCLGYVYAKVDKVQKVDSVYPNLTSSGLIGCKNKEVQLYSEMLPTMSMLWSNGEEGYQTAVKKQGDYSLTLEGHEGYEICDTTLQINVKSELPFDFRIKMDSDTACVGDSINFTFLPLPEEMRGHWSDPPFDPPPGLELVNDSTIICEQPGAYEMRRILRRGDSCATVYPTDFFVSDGVNAKPELEVICPEENGHKLFSLRSQDKEVSQWQVDLKSHEDSTIFTTTILYDSLKLKEGDVVLLYATAANEVGCETSSRDTVTIPNDPSIEDVQIQRVDSSCFNIPVYSIKIRGDDFKGHEILQSEGNLQQIESSEPDVLHFKWTATSNRSTDIFLSLIGDALSCNATTILKIIPAPEIGIRTGYSPPKNLPQSH